jgi:hypothetical protein
MTSAMTNALTRVKTARRPALLAALLVALASGSGNAGGGRGTGPEPGKGPSNGKRAEPGAAKSSNGGARDGSGPSPRSGSGRSDLTRPENLGRVAPEHSEAHRPERPLREDPTFARLIDHVPSLAKIVDKNEAKLAKGLTESNKAILEQAARIMSEGREAPPAKTGPEIRPPESLQQAVAGAKQAIPKPERTGTLKQPGFKADEARRTPVVTIKNYVQGLQGKSREAQERLDTLGQKVAERAGDGQYQRRPSEKDFTRIMQKVREKQGDASQLYDLAAGRVVYPTMEKLSAGLAQTAKALEGTGATIVRVKERFSDPMSSGYRDVLMNIRTKEGIVTELRFELEPLLKISEGEHLPYEIKRGLDDLASREKRELTPDERRLKDTLDQITKPIYDAAFARALGPDAPGHASQPRRAPGRARPFRPRLPLPRYGAGARRRSEPPLPAAHNVPSGADQIAFSPAGPTSLGAAPASGSPPSR